MTKDRNADTATTILNALDREIRRIGEGANGDILDGLREFRENLARWLTIPTDVGTIGEAWASYTAALLNPIQASEVQREEAKRAFYAGAASMFGAMLKAAELDEDEAAARVEGLDRELVDYLRLFKVREGV